MRFKIEYASGSTGKPCAGAERVVNGDYAEYFADINTMEDLVALSKESKNNAAEWNNGMMDLIINFKEELITIYDSWIE